MRVCVRGLATSHAGLAQMLVEQHERANRSGTRRQKGARSFLSSETAPPRAFCRPFVICSPARSARACVQIEKACKGIS
jgi:hypothetical protein